MQPRVDKIMFGARFHLHNVLFPSPYQVNYPHERLVANNKSLLK